MCKKGFELTVEGLDGAVLLLPVRLQQSSMENAAEVTCRFQHGEVSQHQSAEELKLQHVKFFQVTSVQPPQNKPPPLTAASQGEAAELTVNSWILTNSLFSFLFGLIVFQTFMCCSCYTSSQLTT